ncbi:protein zwilch homolog isoform X2 [Apis cerana]|uniref:protein zwilch homolog isoform X2 n=1 Tax=Apis cerana TaxID=7461 RepID=UPI002B2359C1|nr:protein zwilch homolog isoform X2 [Apis cerana]
MFEFESLRKILDPSIKIDKICLSYVTRIFPQFKNTPYVILYKEACKSINNCSEFTNADQSNQFEITGSPLKYSFGEDDFENSTILIKQNWYKEEEKYLPLNRTEACTALNACIEFINDSFFLIFALCDEIETFEFLKESSSKIFQQHLEFSHACEQDISVSVFNTFDLFGTKEKIINKDYNIKSNFEGSLSIEVDTCSLSLYPLTRASKNNLIVQIVTNSNNSPLKELWKQLLLLNQYLSILEDYTKNISSHYNSIPLKFPQNFVNPYNEEHDVVLNNLNLLLNGDYSFRNSDNIKTHKINFLNEENLENEIRIYQCVENLPLRHNLDFTDFLWELLIKNSNYFEIIKCIHIVLEEIIINDCLPQINFTNSTKFSKIINNPQQQKIISHFLSGSLPLEYLIDMGFEKLYKDYIYILVNSRFNELHDIQQKLKNILCDEFTVDIYRKKLLYLVQIHICLEFMLLIQDNLECSSDDLRILFSYVYNQYIGEKSPLKSCDDLNQNKIYILHTPLPFSAINNLNKMPSIRRISLSSQSKLTKLTTIKYYSESPIFPTNIYELDNSDMIDEGYHVLNAICSSNKFK